MHGSYRHKNGSFTCYNDKLENFLDSYTDIFLEIAHVLGNFLFYISPKCVSVFFGKTKTRLLKWWEQQWSDLIIPKNEEKEYG